MIATKLIIIASVVLFRNIGTVSGRLDDLVGPLRSTKSGDETLRTIPLLIQFGDDNEFSFGLQSIQGAIANRIELDFMNAYAVTADMNAQKSLEAKLVDGSITKIDEDVRRGPLMFEQRETLEFSFPEFESRRLQEYNLDLIQIPEAHIFTKGDGAKICLIDSGVDTTHIDLDEDRFKGLNLDSELRWDFDLLNHGTFLAGIISATHDNAFEVEGIAPEAEVLVLRVFENSGSKFEFSSGLVKAVERCAIAGVRIVNLSLGGLKKSELEQEGLSKLVDRYDLLIVAAGGNNGYDADPMYPASYEDVISVGAINKDKVRWSRSRKDVDIVAPGEKIRGLRGGTLSGFERQTGTSIACVHISAVAALLWSWKPDASVSEIKNALFHSAEFLESPGSKNGKNAEFGHGMVQAMCALIYLNGGTPLDPSSSVNESCPPFDENSADSPSNIGAEPTQSPALNPTPEQVLTLHPTLLVNDAWVSIQNEGESNGWTSLDISDKLQGYIPTEIGLYPTLILINLYANRNIGGSLPSEIGQLTKLTYLEVYLNKLSGSVPSEIGQLTELTYLLLNNNDFSASVPSEIGQLTELISLYLFTNNFSTSLPSEIGQLAKLTRLDLDDNKFNGLLPSEIGQLTELTRLNLDYNQFNGSLPSEIGQLTELTSLYLSANDFSGSMPSEIGQLTKLNKLTLQNNNLSGSIPSALCGATIQVNCVNVECTCCECF